MTNSTIISVQNISKAAGSRQLLDAVTFDIEERSLVSIIGPNGAGKTTLVKVILGLDSEYTGEVTLRERERVQYIPQVSTEDRYQLPISVREYLSIGATPLYRRSGAKGDFEAMLTHVGVRVEALNQSYGSLSGGERQRVAIARALLSDPTVLVLDEPFAAVDYGSRTGLYELVRHLQKDHGMTVLLVSHDVESVLPLSDRVLCLNVGLHKNCHPAFLHDGEGREATQVHHHC